MKRFLMLMISGLLITGFLCSAEAQLTANDIIKKMENNQTHKTSLAKGVMAIYDKYGATKKNFTMTSEGSKAMMLEFTNPEDAGQKILRTGNEIYLYFPKSEKVIIIQGSALKDKVMGSDFSYEDMTGGRDILSAYTATLTTTENTEITDENDKAFTVECYKIKLEALNKKQVVYPLEYLWIDKALLAYRKVQSCTADGKVLKEMAITEIKAIDGKNIPVHMVMKDAMKKASKTVLTITEMEIGLALPPDTFGFKELAW